MNNILPKISEKNSFLINFFAVPQKRKKERKKREKRAAKGPWLGIYGEILDGI